MYLLVLLQGDHVKITHVKAIHVKAIHVKVIHVKVVKLYVCSNTELFHEMEKLKDKAFDSDASRPGSIHGLEGGVFKMEYK